MAIEEPPDHGGGETFTAIGDQPLPDFQQRHVRLAANEAEQIIAMGLDANLNEALRVALRNTIDFLTRKAGLSRDRAYSLASLGIDFRVTQMVDVNNGVHAMIPKSMFAPDYRKTIAIA